MGAATNEKIYQIQGLSCASCAAQFERNVCELPAVKDAKVNFAASKITVYGEASLEEIQEAGAFDHLKIYAEHEEMIKTPLWKKAEVIRTFLSGLLLLGGWILLFQYGEESWIPRTTFLAAILVGGYFLFLQGLKNLFKLRFDMKTLMTVAVIGAAAIGEWGEGATVVFLFAISEALEAYSMDRARQSIRGLMDIAPKEALIRRAGQELHVPVKEIQIGDVMLVKPGQKIAMDGRVLKGVSYVNQAAITGESIPVLKQEQDEVFAGTLNEEGHLEIEVTKLVENTTLAKIIHLVEKAQEERAPSQAFVDRFAKYYTPAVMLIALFIVVLPPLLWNGDWHEWIYRGLAVLVVACPCALVISTPVAIVTAIGNAARNGVLIKGGAYLEEMGALSAVALDKTGTLTQGAPQVTDVVSFAQSAQSAENETEADHNNGLEPLNQTGWRKGSGLDGSSEEWLNMMVAIEMKSQHPLAVAIVKELGSSELEDEVVNFKSLSGKGVQADLLGQTYRIGNPRLFEETAPELLTQEVKAQISRLQEEGKTVIIAGSETKILGLVALRDELRQVSAEVIQKLHQLGISRTLMLTGDNQQTALAISKQTGIKDVRSELLPENKLEVIHQVKAEGQKVAMVGDGINDAPALAAATVGIAMGGAGTDTALETADIALMGDDLTKLPFTIKLSRMALKVIKQNIGFSLGLKILALLLIVPGWLTLWLAIFADMGATLLVTLNSLRLMRLKD